MAHIKIYWSADEPTPGEEPIWEGDVTLIEDNPYDEGYLFTGIQAEEITAAWAAHPTVRRTSRAYEAREIVIATSLYDEDGHTVSIWECTTEFHDFEEGEPGHYGGGEPAFSTAGWVWDFAIVEEPATRSELFPGTYEALDGLTIRKETEE